MSKKSDGTIKIVLYLSITEGQLSEILLGHGVELTCTGYTATGTIGNSSKKDKVSLVDKSPCVIFWHQSAKINYDDFEVNVVCSIRNKQWGMRDNQANLIIKCDNWHSVREDGERPRYSAEAILHTYVNKSFVEVFKRCNITLNVKTVD